MRATNASRARTISDFGTGSALVLLFLDMPLSARFAREPIQELAPSLRRIENLEHLLGAGPVAVEAVLQFDGSAGLSAMKRTSSSIRRSGSKLQDCVICQASRRRTGGSQATTLPHSHSLPSSPRSNHRPPAFGSMTLSLIGD
jgi:hypothetical protein